MNLYKQIALTALLLIISLNAHGLKAQSKILVFGDSLSAAYNMPVE